YAAWKMLQQLYDTEKDQLVLNNLFAVDPARFSRDYKEHTAVSDSANTLLLDYFKNLIIQPVFATVLDIVREAGGEQVRDKMFTGEHINTSENRGVLHVVLCSFGSLNTT
ncbi:hypothetical protein HETIRDRAFT_322918, partial [Heterobasidion irregulare TC 32-1]